MPPTRGNLKPLSPRVLMANTAPNIVGYSEGCKSITQLGDPSDWQAPAQYSRLSSLGPVYRQFYRVQCSVSYPGRPARSGTPKKVILCWPGIPAPGLRPEEMVPGRPAANNPVWVSCSCNYFRYVCEWALTRYGSSDIIYSNGQPARFTNPRGIGTLCKHIYAVLPEAISSWSGESPEERAVEEQDVQEVPVLPEFSPPEELPPDPDLSPAPEESEEERLRGANFSLVPGRYSIAAARLRSIALPFDAEFC